MDKLTLICLLVCLTGSLAAVRAEGRDRVLGRLHAGALSLSGEWRFKLDPKSVGEKDGWFGSDTQFTERIRVPGCWDAQGKGIPGAITTIANADDTEPHVRTISAYNGDAWYKRAFRIPRSWRGKVIWLNIGGVNDRAKVWVNGRAAGSHDGYCTGFRLDVTNLVEYDKPNQCAILVSNAPRPEGNLEGCFDFYTNWGGIYRDVWLESTETSYIEGVRITPDITAGSINVETNVVGRTDGIRFTVFSQEGKKIASADSGKIVIPNPKLWSPNSPYLYRLRAELIAAGKTVDSVIERFGMREIAVKGNRIMLNGKPIFLRGYGDDCIYPITVAPPASKEHYLKELRRAKSYGFNFARHHTWIPLPEHLDAADEVGILVQMEMPTGAHPFTDPSPFLAQLWRDELQRVMVANANHPSWIILSMGNELGDALNDEAVRKVYFGLTALARKLDPTRLVIVTSGSTTPLPPEEPFYSRGVYGVTPLSDAAEGLSGWIAGHDRPYVWHEMGYYASYPDVDLRAKYTGGAIPFWLNEAARVAEEKGFADMLPTYVRNSVRLQQVCLKWSMELARKIPDLAGFEWWTFKDNSWPTEGIVDDFTDPKRGVDIEAIRRLNSDTVLLLADEPRTARSGEKLELKVRISNFGEPIKSDLHWELGKAVSGSIPGLTVDKYGLSDLTPLNITLPEVKLPAKYVLHLEFSGAKNEWPVWVFPEARPNPKLPNVRMSSMLSEDVISFAENGGRVLLISRKARTGLAERSCAEESPDIPYPLYFAPTYWGAAHAPGGGNLGTVIADHPALGTFPHEGFCDLQFLSLLQGVNRADLDALPVRVNPIVRSITDWRLGANAAYIYEVKIGKGGLLVTTLNFEEGLASKRPEAEWLLQELLSYCASGDFQPAAEIQPEFLRSICPR